MLTRGQAVSKEKAIQRGPSAWTLEPESLGWGPGFLTAKAQGGICCLMFPHIGFEPGQLVKPGLG